MPTRIKCVSYANKIYQSVGILAPGDMLRGEMLIFYETTNIIEATEKKTYLKILGTLGVLTEEKTQIKGVGYGNSDASSMAFSHFKNAHRT